MPALRTGYTLEMSIENSVCNLSVLSVATHGFEGRDLLRWYDHTTRSKDATRGSWPYY